MDCGGCDVSAVGVDGRGDRLLLSNQGLRGWDLFDLSPDRRGVVFSKDPHLYVAHTTGRGKRTLASGYINYARWSPDGRMIAYGLNETHSCSGESLWVINADGSDPHQVADCAMQISWSPDSRRLAFASYSGPNTNGRVAVVNADGSGYRTVSTPGVEIFDVTWAPRGDWIAYDLLSTQGTVHVVRADGREEDTVGSGVFGGWSPDGRRIAYVHIDRTGSGKNAGRSSIRVMNRDGKRGRVLVRGLVGYSIAWSRNGAWIAYVRTARSHCYCRTRLYAVPASGGRPHALSPVEVNAVFGPIYWSRDSRRVFYLHVVQSGE
jgi:Tol biopolymer transport system component